MFNFLKENSQLILGAFLASIIPIINMLFQYLFLPDIEARKRIKEKKHDALKRAYENLYSFHKISSGPISFRSSIGDDTVEVLKDHLSDLTSFTDYLNKNSVYFNNKFFANISILQDSLLKISLQNEESKKINGNELKRLILRANYLWNFVKIEIQKEFNSDSRWNLWKLKKKIKNKYEEDIKKLDAEIKK